MGWLAAQGAIMAIGLFIGLVCSVIGLFFGHIILFDSIWTEKHLDSRRSEAMNHT